MESKWRNYGLWIAVFSFISLFLGTLRTTYGIDVPLPINYDGLVSAFLGIFVIAGILSTPTTFNKGFMNDAFMAFGASVAPWRTVRLWAAIFSFVALVIQSIGVYNIHIILPNNYGDLVNALLGLLTLSGLLYVSPQTITIERHGYKNNPYPMKGAPFDEDIYRRVDNCRKITF